MIRSRMVNYIGFCMDLEYAAKFSCLISIWLFFYNHFYYELMNNGLNAELLRKIYSFHMGAGKEDTNT